MKHLFKTILLFTVSSMLTACHAGASKDSGEISTSTEAAPAVTIDTTSHNNTSTTTTTTSSVTTVDPKTNDTTIVTKTVIKHSGNK